MAFLILESVLNKDICEIDLSSGRTFGLERMEQWLIEHNKHHIIVRVVK